MSTRSTTHFHWTKTKDDPAEYGELAAIVYRHADGYPSGAGVDLQKFIARTGNLPDSRHDDAAYLAARYVVFLAEMFAIDWRADPPRPKRDRLDFISCGIVREDPGDIDYRYHIQCGQPPIVTCERIDYDWKAGTSTGIKIDLAAEIAAEQKAHRAARRRTLAHARKATP